MDNDFDNGFYDGYFDDDFDFDPIFEPSDSSTFVPFLRYPSLSASSASWYTANYPHDWDDASNTAILCHTSPNPENAETYTWAVEQWRDDSDLDDDHGAVGGDGGYFGGWWKMVAGWFGTAAYAAGFLMGWTERFFRDHLKTIILIECHVLLLLILELLAFLLLPANLYTTLCAFLNCLIIRAASLFLLLWVASCL
ncbi:hypothetical protein HDV00_004880 [Rhizophlyctis rosea]|nr:hypothetical protein HDV00_004880 [Rhizophlyctis rosea]